MRFSLENINPQTGKTSGPQEAKHNHVSTLLYRHVLSLCVYFFFFFLKENNLFKKKQKNPHKVTGWLASTSLAKTMSSEKNQEV